MSAPPSAVVVARRVLLRTVSWCALGCSGALLAPAAAVGAPSDADAAEPDVDEDALIRRLVGGPAVESPRVRLVMPPAFGNGYSVPMTLSVESAMTQDEHVTALHVLAPLNPIVMVAKYEFNPRSGRAAIATRIRLAKSQNVLAVAEMSDGALLMARAAVKVETDGCA